jgi:hypothetical protein
MPAQVEESSGFSMSYTMGVASLAGAAAAVVGRSGRNTRTARKAEPVSAAAGAAVAAGKAAAAAKATAAAGAKAAGTSVGTGAALGKEPDPAKDAEKPDFDPADQIGVTQPLGFFDPAGFTKKGDEQGFRNLRAAEIKHGRVAMMASVGAVIQHYVVFPGFESVPRCMGAVVTMPGTIGFAALFAVAGLLETTVWTESDGKEPGNFGDPVGLNMYTEDMRNKEINNGRMAMFASLGIIAANLVTGKDAIQQFGL